MQIRTRGYLGAGALPGTALPWGPVKQSIWAFTQGLRALEVVSLSLEAGHLCAPEQSQAQDNQRCGRVTSQAWAMSCWEEIPQISLFAVHLLLYQHLFVSAGNTLLLMSATGSPNAVPLLGVHMVAVSLQHKEKAIPQTSHSPVSWEGLKPSLSPRTGLGDPVGISRGRGDASCWAVRSYFKLWQRKKRYTDS